MKHPKIPTIQTPSPWRSFLKGAASIFDISGGSSRVNLRYSPKLGTPQDDAKALALDLDQVGRDIDKMLSNAGLSPRRRKPLMPK
jgi:hypothetical protein